MKIAVKLQPTFLFRIAGGRGIKICERWRYPYEFFIDDMGRKPSRLHTLDRINVDGDYEPANCRWAPPEVQANNKRTCRMITFDGRTQSLTLWAREKGMSPLTLTARILHYGWPLQRALTEPVYYPRQS